MKRLIDKAKITCNVELTENTKEYIKPCDRDWETINTFSFLFCK